MNVKYVRRPDGARTAYVTMGSGPVLVLPPGGTTHLDWYTGDTDAHEKFCARLAEHRTLVLYDRHGCGLSDRNRTSFTPEDDMLDIETVIDSLGTATVDLFGISWGGSPSLAYAARHPERVRRMVLYGTFAQGRVGPGEEVEALMAALDALRRTDWVLYTKTRASVFFPNGTDQQTFQSFARMVRDSTTPEMFEQLEHVVFDNQSLLSQIMTPTLVLHRRGDQACLFEWGQYLARRLPNASFVPLDGDAHFPWVDDVESVLRPTIEFLTEGHEPEAPSRLPPGDAPVTILFTDMEGSTDLTQRLGDAGAQEVLRTHNAIIRDALKATSGSEVKHTGDGIMASFPSASRALEAAVAMQKAFAEQNQEQPDTAIRVRIGLNAGEPLAEDDDLFGTAVQLAARVCAQAEPGQILTSNVVQELAAGKGFDFADKGEAELKGFEKAVRLHEVRWQD